MRHGETGRPRRRRLLRQPRVEHRPDNGSDGKRLLLVAAVGFAAAMAVLLVGRRDHRSLFAARHEYRHLCRASRLPRPLCVAGPDNPQDYCPTQVHMKTQCVRHILVSQRHGVFRSQLISFLDWYNEYRPHMKLGGRTPNEVYFRQPPANRRPRIEPRTHWPRRSCCARPQTLVAGQPGDRFTMQVGHLNRQRHLPIVTLRRAA